MAEEQGQGVRVLEELGVTPGGKAINYVKRENATIRFIAFGDGGALPKILAGGFSSVHNARMAVHSYLKGLEPKSKKVVKR